MLRNNFDAYHSTGQPIDLETHILAATRDGFWDDSRPEVIEKTLDRYLANKRVTYREASHLWVVASENISALIEQSDLSNWGWRGTMEPMPVESESCCLQLDNY
ncbi:MAG: hypothetical protein GY815_16740 [Gammaproteobacteria bacterium]|nr:hypothetical protein [Gammaproteobacteria bacterium]